MTSEQYYNGLAAQKLIEEFAKRNMDGFYCKTRADAHKKLIDLIPKGASVSYGGSLTLEEIGAKEALGSGEYNVLDPNAATEPGGKEQTAREALSADYFLMSANAIAMTGELVNADGIGNRVAALIFGPKNVIVVAGMNKVESSLEAAISRVKNQTAQKCLVQYYKDYASFDELAEAARGAISHLVITGMSVFKGRVKIILVGEHLGV